MPSSINYIPWQILTNQVSRIFLGKAVFLQKIANLFVLELFYCYLARADGPITRA